MPKTPTPSEGAAATSEAAVAAMPAVAEAGADETVMAAAEVTDAAKAADKLAADELAADKLAAEQAAEAEAERAQAEAEARQAEQAAAELAETRAAELRAAEQQAADLALAEAEAARLAAETVQAELAAVALAEKKAAAKASRAAAKAAKTHAAAAIASATEAAIETVDAAEAAAAPLGDILLSLGEGAQAASREWLDWIQARARNRAAGLAALMQCRTPPELALLQGRLVREEVELLLSTGVRVCDISVATATSQAASVVAAR